MIILKNFLVLLIGLSQTIISGLWFASFALDTVGLNFVSSIHFSVHILFAILFFIGAVNIYLTCTNFAHLWFKTSRKYNSSFSVAMLSVILTIILFLMIRFAFSL